MLKGLKDNFCISCVNTPYSNLDALEAKLESALLANNKLRVLMDVNGLDNLDGYRFTQTVFEAIENLVWLKDLQGNYIEMNSLAKDALEHLRPVDNFDVINDTEALEHLLTIHEPIEMSFLFEDISLDKAVIESEKKLVNIKKANYQGRAVTAKFSKYPIHATTGEIVAVLTVCEILESHGQSIEGEINGEKL